MSPAKNSPQIALPPMRSRPAEVTIAPDLAAVPTCTPFTNSRSVAPSYVTPRCAQVLAVSAAVPFANSSEELSEM
jgi:hypothetical protein